jgi:GT2 family glycosyltransferase
LKTLPNSQSSLAEGAPLAVNSEAYWSQRFASDWQALGGGEQSRFFYQIALDNLPEWFIRYVRAERASICDWGCASGEGTDLLAQALGTPVTGIDFAPNAIADARSRFKKPSFLAVDLLKTPIEDRFDVLFCSNTLEHFADPWGTLETVAAYARNALVVLVPFREVDRHHEHESTFTEGNIPVVIGGKFHLAFSCAVDTGRMSPSYWHGEQIMLVYATRDRLDQSILRLEDLAVGRAAETLEGQKRIAALIQEIGASRAAEKAAQEQARAAEEALLETSAQFDQLWSDEKRLQARIKQLMQTSTTLSTSLQASERKVEELARYVQNRERLVQAKDRQIQDLSAQIEALRASESWRVTAPLRMGTTLMRSSIRTSRSLAARTARMVYWALPLSDATRAKVRARLRRAQSTAVASGASTMAQQSAAAATQKATAPVFSPPLTRATELPDVFVWGIIDWHFRIQRPQHIARGFAQRGHRVFYFSNAFVNSDTPGYRLEPLSDDGLLNVVYLNVKGTPSIYARAPSADVQRTILASLAVFIQEAMPHAVVSLVQHPFWMPFADKMPNRRLVYDMMDHHEGFGDNAPGMLELEHKLLAEADHVVVTSTFLEEIASRKNSSVSLVRNAGEYSHFCNRPDAVFTPPQGRRVIGYYGAIADWFDADLVEKLAQRFPNDLILLVGADSAGVQDRLRSYGNVMFTGEVKYDKLPYYLYAFDVCLLPFKVIPLTLATNPVKVYEYLSAGKPVVCVDLPEITQFEGLVTTAGTHETFLDGVAAALENPGDGEAVEKRRQFAAEQTWTHRVEKLARHLESMPRPKASVVIVTYNKLNLTHACLHSLEANTHYENVEIIVVDNGSADGTPDYLKVWASRGRNRQIILNQDNKGFAAANNQGMRMATGDYLVLLNNDTYVTPGWLGTLLAHLKRHDDLAMIGPVTNSIGNEAKIDISYSGMEEMSKRALQYTSGHLGHTYPLQTVAFFCVALPRRVLENVGELDEAFGVGMFEDDDYCRRVELAGMRVACAEDVFVHHEHSASFNEIAAGPRRALFQANRDIYEKKWGPWLPHTYRRDKPDQRKAGRG